MSRWCVVFDDVGKLRAQNPDLVLHLDVMVDGRQRALDPVPGGPGRTPLR
jgi:hypothetical protein